MILNIIISNKRPLRLLAGVDAIEPVRTDVDEVEEAVRMPQGSLRELEAGREPLDRVFVLTLEERESFLELFALHVDVSGDAVDHCGRERVRLFDWEQTALAYRKLYRETAGAGI